MIVYECPITGDEMFSDTYDIKEIMDGFFLEAQGKRVTVGGDAVDIGANPSAEGGDEEGVDDAVETVIDIIHNNRLSETSYGKKDFKVYYKSWCQALAEKLPEDQFNKFKEGAANGLKYLNEKFDDLQFFTGESMNPDGAMVYCYYAEGATEPTFLVPALAMKIVKV
eukprot:TRINITY_DN1579_c0_g2_i1.p1 TRINITY_DN1579_c0_g2~~TRINITY_DN1579_c0_g2_i1.p1  ORF type:complete len:167 (-),score=27.24 TRINITY_DN1579_c0_g2_i1:195-695(-)